MSATYLTRDGDMIDAICFGHYGRSIGVVEVVLEANPKLADLGSRYDAGVLITLPDIEDGEPETAQVRLWD
ncbi:tail protein X [Pyruvatibacter mobilis]|uniref:tail protein X n=1 Tax=Pyruvatibacter mobilis TaxID=1712261 RepID=UPI003C7A8597